VAVRGRRGAEGGNSGGGGDASENGDRGVGGARGEGGGGTAGEVVVEDGGRGTDGRCFSFPPFFPLFFFFFCFLLSLSLSFFFLFFSFFFSTGNPRNGFVLDPCLFGPSCSLVTSVLAFPRFFPVYS